MEIFLEQDNYSQFFVDLQELSDDAKAIFKSTFDQLLEDKEIGTKLLNAIGDEDEQQDMSEFLKDDLE